MQSEEVKAIVKEAIKEIMESNSRNNPIEDSSELVNDLGFTSLDVAELVAVLEMELDYDPFSKGVSLLNVRTVADFYEVYSKAR
jgi:acyl carrier protein